MHSSLNHLSIQIIVHSIQIQYENKSYIKAMEDFVEEHTDSTVEILIFSIPNMTPFSIIISSDTRRSLSKSTCQLK